MKKILPVIHKTSGLIAFILIASFFISSVYVDFFGNKESVLSAKVSIFYGIWLLIPLMAITGITGAKMAPKRVSGPIASKKKRMPFIALNGLFILLPAAFVLKNLALEGDFSRFFYIVQTIELMAGFINLTLMGLNIRDAFRLKRPKANVKVTH